MGNQLVSSVKVVIRPIDYYLAEVPEFKLKVNLGQTQFFKVALCQHGNEGDVVVKVLPHEDPSLLLEAYKRELEALALLTAGNVSIAAFRLAEIRPNFAFIVRQYVRFSLYDRLLTRPFLTHLEKCWLVYQIFKCMAWCHQKGIRHGDLKLENILVTSSLWIVIADFATYKPASLPDDNPSFFNYFFDTSRRRCCNIAPERFISSSLTGLEQIQVAAEQQQPNAAASASSSSSGLLGLVSDSDIRLTASMDMFSIGCILAEIFSDRVLFDLSGLLHYKDGSKATNLASQLKQIDNETVRELVANLTSLAPASRKSCEAVLSEQRGNLFPAYFDKLYGLMRTLVRLPPDAKILYLAQELNQYLPLLLEENPRGVLILLTMITSSLRSLMHIHCKIEAQRLICRLVASEPASLSPFVTDRLIPYLASCLQDGDHRVRGEAVLSMTHLLEQVTRPPPSDNNLFTDYLLEILVKEVASDKSTYVRLCLARCIGRLSQLALHFLNQSVDHNYDEELSLLHNYFQNLVSQLLTDSNNCVRRTLLMTPENCSHLCTFFGQQKTNEVIVSHIITFLNDKNDFQLRLAFFDNIIVIASYLGVQCSPILYPLLQQGLCDAEELVICKAISSVASLTEQGLLQKNVIYDLLREILPLLYHPNQWITHSIVELFTTLSEHLSVIDLHCKVLPMISPFLARPLHSLGNKYLILDSLHCPVSRHIFDIILDSKDSHGMFEGLRNKTAKLRNTSYKRLEAENIKPFVERQLLALADLLLIIHRNRRNYLNPAMNREEVGGQIVYNNYDKLMRSLNLVDSFSADDTSNSAANQEWQHMFGPRGTNRHMLEEGGLGVPGGDLAGAGMADCENAEEARETQYIDFECPPCGREVRALKQHKKSGFTPATIRPMIGGGGGSGGSGSSPNGLSQHFKPRGFLVAQLYEHRSAVNGLARYGTTSCFFTASDDGSLRLWDLANFESRHALNRSKWMFKMEFSNGAPINFKGVLACGGYVVTYTGEGMIYIFEPVEAKLEHVCSFKPGGGGGGDGSGKSKSATFPLLITSMCALSGNVFAVSLTNSMIYGFDIRNIHSVNFFVPIFKVRLPPNQRTITAVDGAEVVLFAGTAFGYIAGFDMRFNVKVSSFNQSGGQPASGAGGSGGGGGQPNQARISKLRYSTEGLYVSAYGTTDVMLWDYKTSERETLLRTSKHEGHEETHTSATKAILPIGNTRLPAVITGGTDLRIRYWDLKQAENSYIISDPELRKCHYSSTGGGVGGGGGGGGKSASTSGKQQSSAGGGGTHYFGGGTALDGHHHSERLPLLATYRPQQSAAGGRHFLVVEEVDASSGRNPTEETHNCIVEHQTPHTAHHDPITDLLNINQYLISAGRNGTVKVWR